MKNSKRTRRIFVLTTIYLSAATLCFGILSGIFYEKSKKYEQTEAYQYQHAFGELVTAVGEMDSALQKSVYAISPGMVSAVCTELFGKAMTAQMSISALPYGAQELEQTSGFINRVGDYAFALSRAAAAGNGYSDEQLEKLKNLSETASVLSDNLKSLQAELQAGNLSLTQVQRSAGAIQPEKESSGYMGDSIQLIEQEFPEVPSLIYDGPFSEHIKDLTPKALENSSTVDQEQAREAAAGFLDLGKSRIYFLGECEGDIPCYCFGADGEGGSSTFVYVTKQGGQVMTMMSSRPIGSENISLEDAIAQANAFLQKNGYKNMTETYHMTQGGILTVNYAFKQENTLCYSDLVKVSVALDTGKICGFEAKGYLMAHETRSFPEITVSEQEAQTKVPNDLTILAHQIALIPTDGKYEVLCHEFKCQAPDERHYIIYVNVITGTQEKILILLEDASGTLTL